MKTKRILSSIRESISAKMIWIRSGEIRRMKDQCAMDHASAVAWQAALILSGKRSIITRSQSKLNKANGQQWINRGLTLSPANEASPYFKGSFNHCPFASPGCIAVCVGAETGQGRLPSSKIARIGRTLAMHYDFDRFFKLLRLEIEGELIVCRSLEAITGDPHRLAFRTNVASDNVILADDLCNSFPNWAPIVFYDYTVIKKALGSSYVHRGYSRKEDNHDQCLDVLASGYGVAVVFGGPIPSTWQGYPVIDGDVNDLWFTRAPESGGFVVGLKVKGTNSQKQFARDTGFAVGVQS